MSSWFRLPGTRMLTDVLILTLGITVAFGDVGDMTGSLPVRLLNGERCSGGVEVYHLHQWGALCTRRWGLQEAGVVCRKLGCGWATSTPIGASGGDGGGSEVMWHVDMRCSGEEEELSHCSVHSSWDLGTRDECHSQDVAVVECSVELHTPEIWYNASVAAPPSRVVRGHSFNVTCSVPGRYAGSSMQLRIVRSNGTERHVQPAHAPAVTFAFASAQLSHEGYYYCLHRVQLGERVFTSRESQPLPLVLIEPEPLLSATEVSWLVSAVVFVVAVLAIVVAAFCLQRRKRRSPTELERGSRKCVENTYIALPGKEGETQTGGNS